MATFEIYDQERNTKSALLINDLATYGKRGFGADEKTRTSTGSSPTATSTLRVYQFRHVRLIVAWG